MSNIRLRSTMNTERAVRRWDGPPCGYDSTEHALHPLPHARGRFIRAEPEQFYPRPHNPHPLSKAKTTLTKEDESEAQHWDHSVVRS
jgi:hypothetical protein